LATYKNTSTKTILKIKPEFTTVIVTQIEYDLYKDENIYLFSDGTRIPEKVVNKLFHKIESVPKETKEQEEPLGPLLNREGSF
jgi:hypothetical protein